MCAPLCLIHIMHGHTNTHIHTCTCTFIHACLYACIHRCTCTHTHTHTHTHTQRIPVQHLEDIMLFIRPLLSMPYITVHVQTCTKNCHFPLQHLDRHAQRIVTSNLRPCTFYAQRIVTITVHVQTCTQNCHFQLKQCTHMHKELSLPT